MNSNAASTQHKSLHLFFTLALGLSLALALLVGLNLTTAAPAWAAGPWYVDGASGNDSNTCLIGNPCATIQAAIGKASPGDTIYVAASTLYNERVVITQSIHLRPAGASRPIIDRLDQFTDAVVIAPGVSHVSIDHFHIRNTQSQRSGQGVGIKAYNPTLTPTEYITLTDNLIEDTEWAGIMAYNTGQSIFNYWYVANNRITFSEAYTTNPNQNVYGLDLANISNSTIAYNEISGGYVGLNMSVLTDSGSIAVGNNSITNNHIESAAWSNIYISSYDPNEFIPAPPASTPVLNNLVISQNRFTNTNTHSSGNRAIWVYKQDGAINNIAIMNNVIWAANAYAHVIEVDGANNVNLQNNQVDVINPTGSAYMLAMKDVGGGLSIQANNLALSGSSTAAFHGINLEGGATGSVAILNNTITGSDVGNNGVGVRLINSLPGTANISLDYNTITGFDYGFQADNLAGGITVDLAYNRIVNNSLYGALNGTGQLIVAENNWWGCNSPPDMSGPGCATANPVSSNIDYDPWLELNLAANPPYLHPGHNSTLMSTLYTNSNSTDTSPNYIPDGATAAFSSDSLGSVAPSPVAVVNAAANSTFTAGAIHGTAVVSVTVDGQTVTDTIIIGRPVHFSSDTYTVFENAGPAQITVILSRVPTQTTTVDYATSDGTALAGSDYLATSGTLTFDPGQASRVFTVPIILDETRETDETVNLALSNPQNADLSTPYSATLTIIDPSALRETYLPMLLKN